MTLDDRSNSKHIEALTKVLQHKVPQAELTFQGLPLVPQIELALIDSSYPQADLSTAQVEFLMDEPPYWAFCWASGQVMAKYIFENPKVVKGKHIIDFGCGSGVVAIAAKKAGAATVVAIDIDEVALLATQLNAQINSTDLETANTLNNLPCTPDEAILLIADVFYDEKNIPMLADFIDTFADVIIADSRVKPASLVGVTEIKQYTGCTVPDLDESSNFNSVRVYRIQQ